MTFVFWAPAALAGPNRSLSSASLAKARRVVRNAGVNESHGPMPAGSDWTRTEVEATVSDYFDMLSQELRGEPFNKAEHNRRLLKFLPGRTKGSIERKHQNISVVLIDLGFPYIEDTSR